MTESPLSRPAAPPQQKPRSRWALIVTGIIGGALLLGAIATAAITGMVTANRADSGAQGTIAVEVQGIKQLELTAGSADFSVVFDARGDQAELDVRHGAREWVMQRDGDTLVVDAKRTFWPNWLFFGIERQQVVLHLPEQLRDAGLDADLELSSGRLQMEAAFGELNAKVSSGAMRLSGSAGSLDAAVSSGRMEFLLEDVQTTKAKVSSGELTGVLAGQSSQSVEVQVSSGLAQLELPNVTYDLRSQVSSGSFDHSLRTDPSAPRVVDVRLSSGTVRLIASR